MSAERRCSTFFAGGIAVDDGDAFGAGDDGGVGDAEEEAVLDYARHPLQGLVERLGVVDAGERAVEQHVAAVGRERLAVRVRAA